MSHRRRIAGEEVGEEVASLAAATAVVAAVVRAAAAKVWAVAVVKVGRDLVREAAAAQVARRAKAVRRTSMRGSGTMCTAIRRRRDCTSACNRRRSRRPRQCHELRCKLGAILARVMVKEAAVVVPEVAVVEEMVASVVEAQV